MKDMIREYSNYLRVEEKSEATIRKYIHDVSAFAEWLGERSITKSAVCEYKERLTTQYAVRSVNSVLSSLNSFFDWLGLPECKVKNLKIQKQIFFEPNKDLTKDEYERLLKTACQEGKKRLYLVMQTICATGIRVSELQYITVSAVKKGAALINCKGKNRIILIPQKLCMLLSAYAVEQHIKSGAVFITKTGKPIDRSNVWTEMKSLCKRAGVLAAKVFPHNLRHLFGKTYYAIYQDIVRLADILGHTSVNTTRIYTIEGGEIHRKRIQNLGLVYDFFYSNTT